MGNQPGSMAFAPIYNPPVPFKGYLPMPPANGSSVTINGMIPYNCNRFSFNLETDSGDIAMHFNPRFEGMNAVIRNTCQGGSWGGEEKQGYFPFAMGQPFEVNITIEDLHYKIKVNGNHFCDYRHRIPKDYVRHLSIEGNVQVQQIRFVGGNSPLYNPPLPVNMHIPGGMHPGKMIRINGQSSYNPSRFNVNMVRGPGFKSNADIAMHCDVRFNFGDSRNVVIRTHRQNGGFGQEEKHATFFPFVPGQPFEIIVRAEHDKYMIAVNNQHMFEFRHRIHPLHSIDHLFIEGDVTISMVQVQ
ncbi:galectin-4-like [Watersipora subatra]|uniref:galectin-4-like n=1 Tax=Watersipora subatra TaxID=2589382 RepID=UPI00355C923B